MLHNEPQDRVSSVAHHGARGQMEWAVLHITVREGLDNVTHYSAGGIGQCNTLHGQREWVMLHITLSEGVDNVTHYGAGGTGQGCTLRC